MQELINKYFYYLFIFTYLFGIIFYDIIGFQFIDEICALIIVLLFGYTVFKSKDWKFNKVFLFVIGVFLFYLAYSFKIHSNSPKAIIMDFLIQMKPYLAFFCVYQMKPVISNSQKKLLNQICLAVWFVILLPIGILGFISEQYILDIMNHPTSYAGCITMTALIYLFTSEYTLKDKITFILLLAIGLVSGKAKFYGFFTLASAFVLYFNRPERLKFTFKTFLLLACLFVLVLLLTREKIEFYFLQEVTGEGDANDYMARFVLYSTSILIFMDYFPFGSGFASFATHASGVYYSDIYPKYGIDIVWGLNKTFTSFIADTYYPSLAQFGVVGVCLYISFWIYLIRKSLSLQIAKNIHYFLIILSIIVFFLIENVADATFTGNRGFFVMLLAGYTMSNLYNDKEQISLEDKDEPAE